MWFFLLTNYLYNRYGNIMGKTTRLTTEQFIELSKKRFENRFSYEKTIYKNGRTKVLITCPVHGDVFVTPHDFLTSKFGCPKCADVFNGITKSHGKEWFIAAREIHGDRYDYSKVEYKNNSTKVCIICPEHGEFWQVPYNHIHGSGCPLCGKRRKKYTNDDFINSANIIHNHKYDYSRVDYKNNKTKVCIICPEHGEFWQTPFRHIISKQGCPECAKINRIRKRTCTTEEFITKAKKVHGEKYDYSKTEYKNIKKKVSIICPEHGEFFQTANDHLNGCGCPKCRKWVLEEEISKFLIENNISYTFQKRFSWLNAQSLDFYLPEYNIAIECQGIQHFTGWNKEKKNLDKTFSLDKKKKLLCEKNSVKVFYYTHSDLCYNFTDIYNKENTFFTQEELLKKILNN